MPGRTEAHVVATELLQLLDDVRADLRSLNFPPDPAGLPGVGRLHKLHGGIRSAERLCEHLRQVLAAQRQAAIDAQPLNSRNVLSLVSDQGAR
ncbi:MAG: hypothetical protein AAF416_17195 [Pseudomonadota bacterium]